MPQVTLLNQPGCRATDGPKSPRLLNSGTTEAKVVVTVAWNDHKAARLAPRAAWWRARAKHSHRSGSLIAVVVPILGPLSDIAVNLMQTPSVGGQTANRHGLLPILAFLA